MEKRTNRRRADLSITAFFQSEYAAPFFAAMAAAMIIVFAA
jgi:hypothetical protein